MKNHQPHIDSLRGIAILLVVIWHYFAYDGILLDAGLAGRILHRALLLAWSGVDLFFLLSGFLIGGSLIANRTAENCIAAYSARRITRILPMTLVHFGVFLLLLTTCPNSLPWLLDDPLPLWTYATFTQNLAIVLSGSFGPNWMGVTWSLALEIQFYIVILVVVRMLPPRLLPCILLAGIAISTLIRPALALAFGPIAAYVLLPARADALFLGSLLAWAAQHPPTHEWLTNHRRLVLPTLATLGGVIAFMVAMNWGVLSWAMSVGGYSIIAVFYATLLLGVMVGRPRLGLLLDRRWLQRLGVISFSVYLWHQPVNGLIRATGASGWTAVGLATAFTLALSTLTWRWVEVPFIALGHKVPFRRQSNAPTRPLLTP